MAKYHVEMDVEVNDQDKSIMEFFSDAVLNRFLHTPIRIASIHVIPEVVRGAAKNAVRQGRKRSL